MVEIARRAIGDHIYLFESPIGGDTCLISAHGGHKKNVESFDVSKIGDGNIKLFFYGPHGKSITAGADFLTHRYTVLNEYPRDGLVENYLLSKYQGRHSKNAETYQTIESQIELDMQRKDQFESNIDDVNADPALKKLYDELTPCHIVTIRNRFKNSTEISLRDVVTAVHNFKPEIKNFHCSFCRTLIGWNWPWTKDEVYIPAKLA
jgi:hypothetical protein